ncbi:MAG: hypothetical protein GQ570_10390 [Helicobacteraceae bacterium]|nr:hypothetical protein [Helicobacteraceae bacterium]
MKYKRGRKAVGNEPHNRMVMQEHYELVLNTKLTGLTAKKKMAILSLISDGSQMTLFATLLEQIGEKIGLDTPEFLEGKAKFAQVREILTDA